MDTGFEAIHPELNSISGNVVDCAYRIHRALGPGLLESVYCFCLAHELRKLGYKVEQEFPVAVEYDGERIEVGFRIDLMVEGQIVVEVKAVTKMNPVFKSQLLTYLRLSRRRLGLLINFNVPMIREGIERLVI